MASPAKNAVGKGAKAMMAKAIAESQAAYVSDLSHPNTIAFRNKNKKWNR